MNPAWNARQRRAYARTCLEAATGPIPQRKALRVAYSVAWRILAGVLCLGVVASVVLHASQTPCATEDSTFCHWDADTQGNGHGRSFTTYWGGMTIYDD